MLRPKTLLLVACCMSLVMILSVAITSMSYRPRKHRRMKRRHFLMDYAAMHRKTRWSELPIAAKAVRDDSGAIHSAPVAGPSDSHITHADIMRRAQNAGATFDQYVSENDLGWILDDGTYVRSGDVAEGPGAVDSARERPNE